MKLVYLDKKDRVRAWLRSRRLALAIAILAVFFLVPIRHESTSGSFVLEPGHRTVVRTLVPGVVEEIYVHEGSSVTAGEPLARMRNVPLASDVARAKAQYMVASDRATSAALHYHNFGSASKERDRLAARSAQLSIEASNLEIISPISGVVLTPRPQDRVGSSVSEGTELVEIADPATLIASIYVSEYDMYKMRKGERARLQVEGVPGTQDSYVVDITAVSSSADPTVIDQGKYKGLHPPEFYLVRLPVSGADGRYKPGMRGVARTYGERKSLASLSFEQLRIILSRKIW
jgi:multidrug efflux pump subunit AcrA (membrane-fusion protein)